MSLIRKWRWWDQRKWTGPGWKAHILKQLSTHPNEICWPKVPYHDCLILGPALVKPKLKVVICWNTIMLWSFTHDTKDPGHRLGDKCPNGGDTGHHHTTNTLHLKANTKEKTTHFFNHLSLTMFPVRNLPEKIMVVGQRRRRRLLLRGNSLKPNKPKHYPLYFWSGNTDPELFCSKNSSNNRIGPHPHQTNKIKQKIKAFPPTQRDQSG